MTNATTDTAGAALADGIHPTSVEFSSVTKVFGQATALDGLSLRVDPGRLLALLGPSGCGKTTALRILAGFDAPTSGQVLVDGRDVSRVPPNKREMGVVFQSYSLFPTMTASENVAFGLRVRGRDRGARDRRATELLEIVGLGEHAGKFPHQMSGGQQQRVALARALAVEPKVLLLDEPLSALDAKVREQLRDEIRRVQTELGVTTVFVTHDQSEALSMADIVGVMRAGRLEGLAAPAELYDRPPTPFVAEFVGSMNRLPGTVRSQHVAVLDQLLPIDGEVPADRTEVEALVRPESLTVAADAAAANGRVTQVTFFGSTTRVHVRLNGGDVVVADLSSHLARFVHDEPVRVQAIERPTLVRPLVHS